ncbi:hypothetical protein ACTXT7_003415 [Hymenolepis weldensis]
MTLCVCFTTGKKKMTMFNLWPGSKTALNEHELLPAIDGSWIQDEIPKHHLLKQLQSHIFIMFCASSPNFPKFKCQNMTI